MSVPALPIRSFPGLALRWGAVLAGMAVGISLHLVLNLAGAALGLAVYERADANGGMPLTVAAWSAVAMLAGALVGGYVAARASGLRRIADGALHGAVAWGATTLAFALIAFTTAGALAGGLFGAIADNARPAGVAAAENVRRAPVAPAAQEPTRVERLLAAGAPSSAWLAGTIVLSLIAGVAGGAFGARGSRRFVYGTLTPGGPATQTSGKPTVPAR
jgi:uncharacterized membrane protein YjfL (UPF0719 family)